MYTYQYYARVVYTSVLYMLLHIICCVQVFSVYIYVVYNVCKCVQKCVLWKTKENEFPQPSRSFGWIWILVLFLVPLIYDRICFCIILLHLLPTNILVHKLPVADYPTAVPELLTRGCCLCCSPCFACLLLLPYPVLPLPQFLSLLLPSAPFHPHLVSCHLSPLPRPQENPLTNPFSRIRCSGHDLQELGLWRSRAGYTSQKIT